MATLKMGKLKMSYLAILDAATAMPIVVSLIVGFFFAAPYAWADEPNADRQPQADDFKRPPIVIVHGAWGGGHQWKPVAERLKKQYNGPIHRVTLTGQGERVHLASPEINLSTHIQDVVNAVSFESLDSFVLIGHSYGGAVISGVADAIPEKISQLIYLDANVLEDGECYLSLMPAKREKYTARAKASGDGWRIPIEWENKTRDVPHQLATLTETLSLRNPLRLKIPTHYWLFSDGQAAEQDERYVFLNRAKALAWRTQVFDWNHNPHRDRPDDLVAELLKVFKP